jgi:hypothetical protein
MPRMLKPVCGFCGPTWSPRSRKHDAIANAAFSRATRWLAALAVTDDWVLTVLMAALVLVVTSCALVASFGLPEAPPQPAGRIAPHTRNMTAI